jgi:hypothetical protein
MTLLACFFEPLVDGICFPSSVALPLSCGAQLAAPTRLVNAVRLLKETCTGSRLLHVCLTLPGPADHAPLLRACRLFPSDILCDGGGAALLAEALHDVLDEDCARA